MPSLYTKEPLELEEKYVQTTFYSKLIVEDKKSHNKPTRVVFDLTKNVVHSDSEESDIEDMTPFCCGPVFLSVICDPSQTYDVTEKLESDNVEVTVSESTVGNEDWNPGITEDWNPGINEDWNPGINEECNPGITQLVYHLDHNLIHSDSEDSYTSIEVTGELSDKIQGAAPSKIVVQDIYFKDHGDLKLFVEEEQNISHIRHKQQNTTHNKKDEQNITYKYNKEEKHDMPTKLEHNEKSSLDILLNINEKQDCDEDGSNILDLLEKTKRDKIGAIQNAIRAMKDSQRSMDIEYKAGVVVLDMNQDICGRMYNVEMEWIKVQQLGIVVLKQEDKDNALHDLLIH